MPPPLALHRPLDPGASRAAYCDATDLHQPWLALGLAALVSAPALSIARRFHVAWSALIALLVAAACLIVASVAHSLDAALTI